MFFTSFTKNNITNPIKDLKDIINKLSLGEVQSEISLDLNRKDEIGEISEALNKLSHDMLAKSEFAKQIGEGEYNAKFDLLSENDLMGKALIQMQNSLKENAEKENKRNWSNVGYTKMGEILRKTELKQEDLLQEIAKFVSQYTKSSQSAIFLIDEDDESHLKLMACYAFNRKKYIENKIEINEGLVGQCFLEKDKILLKCVPTDYLKITSGLGEASPSAVLLMPIMVNGVIFGVIEMATFENYET